VSALKISYFFVEVGEGSLRTTVSGSYPPLLLLLFVYCSLPPFIFFNMNVVFKLQNLVETNNIDSQAALKLQLEKVSHDLSWMLSSEMTLHVLL
jgi:hypothetical protein